MKKFRKIVLSISSNLFLRCLFVSVFISAAVNQVSAQSDEGILEFQNLVYGSSRGELFENPGGITYEGDRQEAYVTDRGNNSISMFDLNGRHLFSFPCRVISPRSGREVSTEPKSIVVNRDGKIYFTDTISQSIQVRNYRGEPLSTIPVIEKLGLSTRKAAPRLLFSTVTGR
jgi:DNA-binding beta-propeller fold protein YncE